MPKLSGVHFGPAGGGSAFDPQTGVAQIRYDLLERTRGERTLRPDSAPVSQLRFTDIHG